MTSMPMRGMCTAPKPGPAQLVATRIQQLEFSFMPPMRSQWNCTLTRPYWSHQISSPAGPDDGGLRAVVRGLAVMRWGLKGRLVGWAWSTNFCTEPSPLPPSLTRGFSSKA